MAKLSKIQDLQKFYEREITLSGIAISKEEIFFEQGATPAIIITEVEKAKIELYNQFIKDLDKLKKPD